MAALVRPLALGCLAPLAVTLAPETAFAQAQIADDSDGPMTQMALTDAQVQAYLGAEAEIAPLLAKQPQSDSAAMDPKLLAALDAAAKSHAFASFDEFEDVGANIGLAMDGIDPATKKYVGADVLLKRQIARVQADSKLQAADKKQVLDDLNQALKSVEPLKNPGNAELALKYYDKLAAGEAQSK